MNETKKLLFNMAKNYNRGEAGAIRAINDENGTLLLEEEQITGIWREYLERFLNVQEEIEYDEANREDEEEVKEEEEIKHITEHEVKHQSVE